jgi:hypothetical protein
MSYDHDLTSFYDLHMSYMNLLQSEVDAGSGSGTSCNFPATQAGEELEPAYPDRDVRQASPFPNLTFASTGK